MNLCPRCGGELVEQDMTGLTYSWPDEAPFDPQPVEWACGECDYLELRGLTPEQLARLERHRQEVSRLPPGPTRS